MTAWKITLLATQWLLLSAYPTGPVQAAMKPLAFQQQHLPPAEYDHAYDGKLTIVRAPDAQVRERCLTASTYNPAFQMLGCSRRNTSGPNTCTIWIVTDDELRQLGWYYDIVLAHEVGHCNGWRH